MSGRENFSGIFWRATKSVLLVYLENNSATLEFRTATSKSSRSFKNSTKSSERFTGMFHVSHFAGVRKSALPGPSGTLSGTLSSGKEPLEGDSRTGEGELPNNPF